VEITDKIVFDNPGGLAVSPIDGKLYVGRRNTLATDAHLPDRERRRRDAGGRRRPAAALAIDATTVHLFQRGLRPLHAAD